MAIAADLELDEKEANACYRVDSIQTRSAAWVPTLSY
jgi:hypothetical protein